jgi:hypothetical protein
VAYAAAAGGGSLSVRSPLVRPLRPSRSAPFRESAGPIHVADLLSREGRPLAASVTDERDEPASTGGSRRAIGFAAGAMLVAGAVVASAFGFTNGSAPTPSASGGEPVGALPSKGAPAVAPAAPAAAKDDQGQKQVTNAAAAEKSAPGSSYSPDGEIGRAASVKPPVQAPAPQAPAPQVRAPQVPVQAAPPPQAPAAGPVQALAAPVADAVGGGTLSNVVTPVTNTVDDTLQPALSLIGGLLGR